MESITSQNTVLDKSSTVNNPVNQNTVGTGKVSAADLELSVSDSLSSQLDFSSRPIRHIRQAER